MVPAHETGAYDDRGRPRLRLQITRQTVPHGNEGGSSSGGDFASIRTDASSPAPKLTRKNNRQAEGGAQTPPAADSHFRTSRLFPCPEHSKMETFRRGQKVLTKN
jgi:hypothetical protein